MKEIIESLRKIPDPTKIENQPKMFQFLELLTYKNINKEELADIHLSEETYKSDKEKMLAIFSFMSRITNTWRGRALYNSAKQKAEECDKVYQEYCQQLRAEQALIKGLLDGWEPPAYPG